MRTQNSQGAERSRIWTIFSVLLICWGLIALCGAFGEALAANALIRWDATTDNRAAGYKIYYKTDVAGEPYNGTGAAEGASPVDVQNVTSKVLTGLDPTKTYFFVVTAYDAAGNESDYSNVVKIAGFYPPVVSITSPATGATVSGIVSVNATASDVTGISKVEFYLNNELQLSQTSAPYVFSWNTSSISSGTYVLSARAYNTFGGTGQSGNVSVTVLNDSTPPVVTLTSPANNATVSGTVSVLSSATDNMGVSKVELYVNGTMLQAGNQAPYTFTWDTGTLGNGVYSLYAKAYDNSGNSGQSSTVSVTVSNDSIAPVVTSFSMPATASSQTVAVTGISASDNIGVTGYMITESSSAPLVYSKGWSSTAPASFTFSSEGTKTAYAWAKDAVGNISASRSATVVITLPDTTSPMVTAFSMPATSSTLTVPVSSFTASDNIGVTGYFVSESQTAPTATASGWSASAPASYTFSGYGTRTAYAWVKDAGGNVAGGFSATVSLNEPDTTAPVVTSFSMPFTSSSLTVSITAFTASDNVAVTGYLVTASSTKPLADTTVWSGKAPTSFTFSSTGTKTAYAWVKDAAGNVSASRTATVSIRMKTRR